MTLKRTLFGSIAGLVTLVLVGSLLVTTSAMRDHLQVQLAVQAQDSATALGLSMSQALASQTQADAALPGHTLLATMLDAVFDRGYFQRISFRTNDQSTILERTRAPVPAQVPGWFARLNPMPAALATTEVMRGWTPIGVLEVQAHPGQAYADLWRLWHTQLLWLAAIAAVAVVAASGLLRVLMRPLLAVQASAQAMAEHVFPPPAPIPGSPELAGMVRAMNHLAERLQDSFRAQSQLTEELRDEARRDPVTGLPNQRGFDARVDALIAHSSDGLANCAAALLTLTNLDLYNIKAGRQAGDALLQELAVRLQEATSSWPDAIISRRSGTDLAVVLPGIGVERARAALHRLAAGAGDLPALRDHRSGLAVAMGMSFSTAPRRRRQLLADADVALRQSQASTPVMAPIFLVDDGQTDSLSSVIRRSGQWQQQVAEAIGQSALTLTRQSWYSSQNHQLLQQEVLVHPRNPDIGVPGTAFQPLAERLGLAPDLDRWLLQQVFAAAASEQLPVAVNISPRSLEAPGFSDWLVAECRNAGMGDRLLLELPEWALSQQPERVELLFRVLRHEGILLSLDQFGTGGLSLDWLHRLGLTQIKVDRSFAKNLPKRQEHQFFLRSLCQIAGTINTQVLVDGVDQRKDVALLHSLGVTGVSGRAFEQP